MRLILFIQILLFSLLTIASCDGRPCGRAIINFGLVGFSDFESDSIIIRKFTKTNAGQVLQDSSILNHENVIFRRSHDTLTVGIMKGNVAILTSDYNYEIFFPNAGKLYALTDIKENFRSDNASLSCNKGGYCANSIDGYTLNGQPISHSGWQNIYISR